MIMLKKSLSILCVLSIITVLCLAVGCAKNNPPAITENIPPSDTTAQSENGESTTQVEDYESTISSVPDTTKNHEAEETTAGQEESSSIDPYKPNRASHREAGFWRQNLCHCSRPFSWFLRQSTKRRN